MGMGSGFYVREQKYICGKDYATAPTMQAEFFEISEKEHKASTRRKKELATSLQPPQIWPLPDSAGKYELPTR